MQAHEPATDEEPIAPWRAPLALGLAAASLPLALAYGYGTALAIASLVVLAPAWRAGDRSIAARAALVAGFAGFGIGGLMLVSAIGLCGWGVLAGQCAA